MIGWMFGESSNAVTGNFKFQLEYSPKVAETSSNLTVVCYPNKSRRSVLPIRVRWFRLKNGQLSEIIGMRGCTYPCEPSDLGCKIKAEVTSLEDQGAGTAEVWFGPIKIDISIKQLLAGVLTTGRMSLPVFIVRDKEKQAQILLGEQQITIVDKAQHKLSFEYSLSEPRIELNPKDMAKLYLRFRDDTAEDQLKSFMSSLFEGDLEKSTRSQSRLFRADNKLQLRFLSRPSRDLLVFSIKAFSAKRQMKSCAIIEKIERIDVSKEELLNTFFQFESLRSDIVRLDGLNRELAMDRDRKTKDLRDLEDEIASVTATYLKIIEDKCKDNRMDLHVLNESYSQLSLRRDDAAARNRLRRLEQENSELKARLKDLTEEVELLQYFKKEKEPPADSMHRGQALLELSKINDHRPKDYSRLDRDKSRLEVANLLDSLHEEEPVLKEKYRTLQQQYTELQAKAEQLEKELSIKIKREILPEVEGRPEQSALVSNSMINASMTSEAEINLLMDKFNDLKTINERLLAENERHMKEREQERRGALAQIAQLTRKLEQRHDRTDQPAQVGIEEEMEELRAERRLLLKKIELLGESSKKLKDQLELEAKCERMDAQLHQCQKKLEGAEEQLRANMMQSHTAFDQSGKLKEINEGLLLETMALRKQNEQLRAQLEQTEVLRKQLYTLRQQASGPVLEVDTRLYEAQRQVEKIKGERNLLELKVKAQSQSIQKLMHELHDKSSSQRASFISDRSGRSTDKYKRRIRELESELELLRRSTDALNRSRDLSADLDQYNSETIDRLTSQLDAILKENERISEMCEKYARDAKQAQKTRAQNLQLRKQLETLQTRLIELDRPS